MSRRTRVIRICSFQGSPDVTTKTTYAELRASALKAGRFSVFEATANDRAADLFTRLCEDPTVETKPVGFPWTEVRTKEGG